MNRREQEKQKARKTAAKAWAEEKSSTFEPTSVRIPEGFTAWKPKEAGIYKLDVIPYVVGQGNRRADAGMLHFERTYYLHKIPGLDGKMKFYCCLYENFHKKCPVCQWLNSKGGQADPELVRNLRNQQRILMNVLDITNSDSKSKGIQILDQAYGTNKHPSFGEMLKQKILAVEDYQDFAELSGGYTLYCTVVMDSFQQGISYAKITNIEMVKRKQEYDEEIIDKTTCLDNLLIEQSYEMLDNVLNQEPENKEVTRDVATIEEEATQAEEEEIDGPKMKSEIRNPKSEPVGRNHQQSVKAIKWEEGDLVSYKGKEMEVLKVYRDGTLKLEWQNPDPKGDDSTFDKVDPGKVTEYTKVATQAPKGKLPVDDDESDEEEELDESDDFDDGDEDSEEDITEDVKPPHRRRL